VILESSGGVRGHELVGVKVSVAGGRGGGYWRGLAGRGWSRGGRRWAVRRKGGRRRRSSVRWGRGLVRAVSRSDSVVSPVTATASHAIIDRSGFPFVVAGLVVRLDVERLGRGRGG
jgi:hypothetical protein